MQDMHEARKRLKFLFLKLLKAFVYSKYCKGSFTYDVNLKIKKVDLTPSLSEKNDRL